MEIIIDEAKSILTEQKSGFLTSLPYPFTHTLSAYTGCEFGLTTCGLYCYAQFMQNWSFKKGQAKWGTRVRPKINAASLLEEQLSRLGEQRRRRLRIFMSSSTDPYQPLENTYKLTQQCLEVFTQYPDLDLLIIQTRSPLAERDFDLIAQIPYAWLSVTIETNDQTLLKSLGGGPSLAKRFALVKKAKETGIKAQITVSPCLPYTSNFVQQLLDTGADRIVVDNFVEGDGTGGKRTSQSGYALKQPSWRDVEMSTALFQSLKVAGAEVGWSASGFCGIPPLKK